MTDDQFKLLLRHLQVIIAILGIIAGHAARAGLDVSLALGATLAEAMRREA